MITQSFDRELRVLEEALKRLNAEYDGFLYGSVSRPPLPTRRHVEEMLRRLSASEDMSAADRYRFSTLQGRFTSLTERWDRLQGEKEAGRRPGLYGHFRETAGASRASGRPDGVNAAAPASVEEERRPVPAGDADRELFERYVAAKKARGEDVSGYRLEGFLEGLERERRKVRARVGEGEILFDVTERDGRVRLVARKRPRGGE
ncbi:MAG: MXAN_5187 C-terminal domain-containing protein [Syntrophomonadaceae bacterium]